MKLLTIGEFDAVKPRKGRSVYLLVSEAPRVIWHLRFVGRKGWQMLGGSVG